MPPDAGEPPAFKPVPATADMSVMRTTATPPDERRAPTEQARRPGGVRHRPDPPPLAAGVEGNRRLTSVNGMVLLILLAIEGSTVPEVRRLLPLHVFIGAVLAGPVLLKTTSTTYRFVRYYRGDRSYRAGGPPRPLLRLIGPLVVVSTFALLGSGIALVVVGPGHEAVLRLHQASFLVWFATMTVHVLGHVAEALRSTRDEIGSRRHEPAGRHRPLRLAAIAAALVAGVGLAATLVPRAAHWTDNGRTAFPGQLEVHPRTP